MQDAVIVSAVRSPVAKGKKDGSLASVHAVELSAQVMRGALDQAKLDIDGVVVDTAPAANDRLVALAGRPGESQHRREVQVRVLLIAQPMGAEDGRQELWLGQVMV